MDDKQPVNLTISTTEPGKEWEEVRKLIIHQSESRMLKISIIGNSPEEKEQAKAQEQASLQLTQLAIDIWENHPICVSSPKVKTNPKLTELALIIKNEVMELARENIRSDGVSHGSQ